MGACNFRNDGEGPSAKVVFSAIVRNAQWEHGHGGYSGTIAEKAVEGYVEFSVPTGMDAESFIKAVESFNDPVPNLTPEQRRQVMAARNIYDEKWGPAVAVKTADNRWTFIGLASS